MGGARERERERKREREREREREVISRWFEQISWNCIFKAASNSPEQVDATS